MAILHPLQSRLSGRSVSVGIGIVSVWVFSTFLGLPHLVYSRVDYVPLYNLKEGELPSDYFSEEENEMNLKTLSFFNLTIVHHYDGSGRILCHLNLPEEIDPHSHFDKMYEMSYSLHLMMYFQYVKF